MCRLSQAVVPSDEVSAALCAVVQGLCTGSVDESEGDCFPVPSNPLTTLTVKACLLQARQTNSRFVKVLYLSSR